MCVCVCVLMCPSCDCVQDPVADTLEQLWVSYNNIEKLKGITVLKKLRVCRLIVL